MTSLKTLQTVISKTEDGFEVAQQDLNMRGPGELFGKKQHGLPELQLGNVSLDIGILEEAHREAFRMIGEDPTLNSEQHKKIRKMLVENFKDKFYLGLMG